MSKATDLLLKRGVGRALQNRTARKNIFQDLVYGRGYWSAASTGKVSPVGTGSLDLSQQIMDHHQMDRILSQQRSSAAPEVVRCGTCGAMQFCGGNILDANVVACGLPNCPFGGSTKALKMPYQEMEFAVGETAKSVIRGIAAELREAQDDQRTAEMMTLR